MEILLDNKLVKYEDNLYNDNGKINFEKGKKVNFDKDVYYIVPGFIDQHIHGLLGCDTMDNSFESLNKQSIGLLKEGTTSFLPTTMTATIDTLNSVLDTVSNSLDKIKGASILGVHLEGPFISQDKIGAQNPKDLQVLSIDNLQKLKNIDLVKIITYAPELDQEYEFTRFLKKNNIIGSVGHSNATCEEVLEAINNGLLCFTHFHNAMSGYANRVPGVVTAGYISKDTSKEIIADGMHVDKYTLQSTYKNIGYENINLITDAMRAKGLADGVYDLGGQEVQKTDSKVVLKGTDTLAGSVLEMNIAVKNMVDLTKATPQEAFQMASSNVAKLLGLNNIGLIHSGYDFDITCLNKEFEVIEVYKKGEKVYDKKSN